MTLELVELWGHGSLGGTALAAARFFPPGCVRLMHALGFWRCRGMGGGRGVGGEGGWMGG